MLTTEKPEELTQQRRSIKMESKEFLLGANVAMGLAASLLNESFEKDEKNLEKIKQTFNAVAKFAFEKSLYEALEENEQEFNEATEEAMRRIVEGIIADILNPAAKKIIENIPKEEVH